MVRSYEVDVFLDEKWCGFILTCWEGEDCVWEQFYDDSSDAHADGNRFLDGCYVKGWPYEIAA